MFWVNTSSTILLVFAPTLIRRTRELFIRATPVKYILTLTLGLLIPCAIPTCRRALKSTVKKWILFGVLILSFDFIAIGEIWANMLHNVYANLVGAHGWSPTARTNPTGSEGNIVFLHLFLDALALQPCNPTCKFTSYPDAKNQPVDTTLVLSARDAWLQADVNRFGGANACLIWRAFASRGLGVNAANHVDDTTLPPACLDV